MTGTAPIAVVQFIGEHPDGQRFEISVEIGQPYQCGNGPEEWACAVGLRGLYDRLRDQHGGDALQALCMAMKLALTLLSGYNEDGGKVLFKTGEPVPLEAYSFWEAQPLS